ncbi:MULTISPECIES: hypothetical protein [unclassified Methanoculleus]|jgi:hypothetical protein|uniref:Uncharacterized protein n=1 Tax=Methanoculleus palmolei TaxID=72612 RepID=A0ABD8A8M7_9EURY|nr:hypothetical protein [Methanoculleus sp. UBA377]MDD2473108.1 hypothetical protein [Methanoculleus sp.]WOX55859.1 hypothetical protein R6Y95_00640 [Methanoculleus palmolei]
MPILAAATGTLGIARPERKAVRKRRGKNPAAINLPPGRRANTRRASRKQALFTYGNAAG